MQSLSLFFAFMETLYWARPVLHWVKRLPLHFPFAAPLLLNRITYQFVARNDLFVPGCADGAGYANKNPFWYKFTCYVSGTLAFVITPKDLADDYDWQLYDVTGLDPNQVFTNHNIIVSGNWAGNPGSTGTSASGSDGIQCASSYTGNEPRFAKMPNLIAGHEYILLVSHFTDSQSGYSLTFDRGLCRHHRSKRTAFGKSNS